MSEHIEPALSAEKWASRRFERGYPGMDSPDGTPYLNTFEGRTRLEVVSDDGGTGTEIPPSEIPALMALANAVVKRFTRDDVTALHALASMEIHEANCGAIFEIPFPCDCAAPRYVEQLKSVAARLSALLPPTDLPPE